MSGISLVNKRFTWHIKKFVLKFVDEEQNWHYDSNSNEYTFVAEDFHERDSYSCDDDKFEDKVEVDRHINIELLIL